MTEKYFYGHQVSNYGLEEGKVDYRAFAHAIGDMVLCNDIIDLIGFDNLEGHNLEIENEEEEIEYREIFQWYIVNSNENIHKLLDKAGECWLYDTKHDITIWGIDHWGTSWDYVCTDIEIRKEG